MGGIVNKVIFPRPEPSYNLSDFDGIDRIFKIDTKYYKNCKVIKEFLFENNHFLFYNFK
jgi:hypothetical protein